MAWLVAVCTSEKRQEAKIALPEAVVVTGGGIESDAHADHDGRPLSLLRAEDIEEVRRSVDFSIPPGALAENLVIEGLRADLEPGMRLRIGTEVLLEIVEKGKRVDEPHSYDYRGLCLLPTAGFFLCALRGGTIRPGDPVVEVDS